jgi:copper chaperone CopZ
MKAKILSMAMVIGLCTLSLFAQSEKSEKFEVAGNCGMCETRIEKAANAVDGVSSADWDKETKMIEVSYNPEKSDIHKIHQAIAKVGHDTKMHKAEDRVYEKLPGCCKYERITSVEHNH